MASYLQPLPLEDEFRCPVCLDELSPCLIYSGCSHRICANCVSAWGTRCPLCRQSSAPRPDHQYSGLVEKQMKTRRYRCTRTGTSDITNPSAYSILPASGSPTTTASRADILVNRYRNLAGGNAHHPSMVSDRAMRMIVCDALGMDNYGINTATASNNNFSKHDENRVIDAILSEAARLSELKRLSLATPASTGAKENFILATKGTAALLAEKSGSAAAKSGVESSSSAAPTMAAALMMNAPSLSTSSFLSKDAPSLDGSSDKTSTIYVDFDYLASTLYLADPSYNHKKGKIKNMSSVFSPTVVVEVINSIIKKMVENGLAPSTSSVRIVAIGVSYAFRDQEMIKALRDRFTSPAVEICIVNDSRKKDDVERQLELDFADSRNDGTVVLVSGDVDFLGSTTKMIREGKIVVIAHNGARSSTAEKLVGTAGANCMWRLTELISSTSDAHKRLVQHHQNQQELEGLFNTEKSKKALEQPELINRQKAFGHGKATTADWIKDAKNPDHKHILVAGVVGHASAEVYVQDTRMRGPSAIFNSTADAKNHNGNIFVIASPSITNQDQLVAVAAFPENWEVQVSGTSTHLKNLEPTAGLETFLLSGGNSQTSSATTKLEWCRAGEGCKRGISCVNAHKRGTPSIVQPSAAPQKPTFSYAAMAANISSGAEITSNAPATIIAASASPSHYGATSPKGTPGSLNTTTTLGADKITVPIGGSSSGATAIVELVNVAGEKMPVTDVEPTSVFQFYKKHPQGIGKICVNYPDCDRGIQCMFVHLKKLTPGEGDEENGAAAGGTGSANESGNASAQQASTPVVSSTTTFPSIPSDATPASRKQRKAQQMQQEENVPTPLNATSAPPSAAVSAAAVESAKKALNSTSKVQTNIANPTTIAAAAALAAAAANPHGESIHNLPHDVNVEGMMIPLYKLEKNGIVEFAKRHPAQPAKWCLHYPNCKGNVKCGFAHPGKNYDKDSIIEDAIPGFEIEGAANVKEAVVAVIDQASHSKESSAAAVVAAAKKKNATADDIEKALQKTPEKAPAPTPAPTPAPVVAEKPAVPSFAAAAAGKKKEETSTSAPPLGGITFSKNSKSSPAVTSAKHQNNTNDDDDKMPSLASLTAPSPIPTVVKPAMPSFSSMAAKNKDVPVKEPPKEPIRIAATNAPRIIAQPPPPGQKAAPVKMVNVDGELVPITELERTGVFDFFKNHPDGQAKWCVHDPGCKHGEKCTFAHRKQEEGGHVISYRGAAANNDSAAAVWQTDDPRDFNVENVIVPRSKLERTAFVDYLKAHPGVIGKWCLKHPECRKGADCSYVHRKQ